VPPGLERAADEPPIPEGVDIGRLPRQVRAELRGLSEQAAEFVAGHLVAAGDLVDQDAPLALRHARAAKRRGSRLPLVREALAETAYAAEDFALALSEYRALRRMTGDNDYLPVIADCERALGRPAEALRVAREARLTNLNKRSRAEMTIVEAGAREDLGQVKEGLRVLKSALSQAGTDVPHEAHARLAYAYAAMLQRSGQEDDAREWYVAADRLDTARELDAADQLERMEGISYDFDFADEAEDEKSAPSESASEDPTPDGPEDTDRD